MEYVSVWVWAPATWMDPFGLNIRIENTWSFPGHQRIVVDTHDSRTGEVNGQIGISFAGDIGSGSLTTDDANSNFTEDGTMYLDSGTGLFVSTAKEFVTTADEDAFAKKVLEGLIGTKGDYSLATNNCRTFSKDLFGKLVLTIQLTRALQSLSSFLGN